MALLSIIMHEAILQPTMYCRCLPVCYVAHAVLFAYQRREASRWQPKYGIQVLCALVCARGVVCV